MGVVGSGKWVVGKSEAGSQKSEVRITKAGEKRDKS